MSKVTVIDAPMGLGKTSWACQMMAKSSDRFVYITPYLDEIDRVIRACAKQGKTVHTPDDTPAGTTKSSDLLRLALEGKNIASTHALFQTITQETIDVLKQMNYVLILDEVLEVLTPLKISKTAIEELVKLEVLKLKDSSKCPNIKKVLPGDYTGLSHPAISASFNSISLTSIRSWAETKRLVWVSNTALVWLFPADVFSSFKKVYALTFLFDGSYLKAYYKLHQIDYEMKSLSVQKRGRGFSYAIVPYDPEQNVEFGRQVKPLVDIYEGRMNTVGSKMSALSDTWWRKKGKGAASKIKNHIRSFFAHNQGERMFTCFKRKRGKLTDAKFPATWTAHNVRATNQYKFKSVLAYTVNRYLNTVSRSYFTAYGFQLDDDKFALSELLQWCWRSRIRDNQPIKLYIPSVRMRTLLKDFLAGGSLTAEITVEPID